MKTIRVALALLLLTSPAYSQGVGQLGSGQLWGNSTASRAPAAPTTVTGIVDRAISSTQGAVLTRQGSAWVGLAPGTIGLPLVSGGAAANVAYGILGLAGGGTSGNTAASARTGLGLGTIATQAASAVAITGGTITGMANPAVGSDVANKTYVDSFAAGITVISPSALATAAVLPQTPTYANGASGVGATLTAGSNAALVVDGVTVTASQRILVKNQASAFQNGIYTVTTVGDGSTAWVLTRATDFDTAAEMLKGSYTFVTAGNTNINSSYVLSATVTTVGTTAADFGLFAIVAGVTSLGSTTGAIALGPGLTIDTATLESSALSNVRLAKTANYTLLNTDKTKTLALGGNAFFTLTVGAASGFDADYAVRIINEDGTSGRGKILAINGHSNFILWPGQAVVLTNQNSAWFIAGKQQRWRWNQQYDLYVATTGSDSNDCIAGGGECLTIQKAVDIGCNAFDTNGYSPRINVADGTYKGFQLLSDCVGGNVVNVIGNIAAPQNVILNTGGAGGAVIYAKDKGFVLISGVKLVGDVAASIGLDCGQSAVIDAAIINFGAFSGNGLHIRSADFCRINQTGNWFVTGSALAFIYASNVSVVAMQGGGSIDIAAALTFSYLLLAERNSVVVGGSTFTGSTPTTTINTCLAQLNGVIQKVGSAIPGTQACDQATSTATGGQVQ